jgi:hypothetical protein
MNHRGLFCQFYGNQKYFQTFSLFEGFNERDLQKKNSRFDESFYLNIEITEL